MIDAIIVGLGNPGKDYARTRHNVGEETIALLCKRLGEQLKAGRDKALVADARIGDKRVVLAFPTTYMNESGQAVGALMRRHRIIDPAQLIIVHDELDLETGVVRVKVGGGLAGNNGLRSIIILARRILRIAWALANTGQHFDPSKLSPTMQKP